MNDANHAGTESPPLSSARCSTCPAPDTTRGKPGRNRIEPARTPNSPRSSRKSTPSTTGGWGSTGSPSSWPSSGAGTRPSGSPGSPDELWFTDITYIFTWAGWAYLASIIDGCSRKVVGWAIADHMRTELVTDALTMAIERRRPAKGQTIIHSDRGSQYTSHEFRGLALANGLIPSVGHTGICYDNAMAESFNATIKKELIHLHTWPALGKVKSAVFEYIEAYYNRKRPHTRIGNLSPHEFELSFQDQLDGGMGQAA